VTSGASSANVTYAIDAFGRTATRTASGVTTTYRYAGEAETLVTETTGSTTTKYAHSPGGPLARKVGTAAAQVFIRDLHGDAVGRLALTATDMAAATWFSPWGEPIELESTPASLGFQGQLTDQATGAVDMTTRYYLPELGRFTTRDVLFGGPRKPMSLNQFIYTEANPMSHWDPTGMGGPGVGLGCGLDCKQEEEDRMDTLENPGGGGSGTSGTSPSGHDEDSGSQWRNDLYSVYYGREDFITNGPETVHLELTRFSADPIGDGFYVVIVLLSGDLTTPCTLAGTDVCPDYSSKLDVDVATTTGAELKAERFTPEGTHLWQGDGNPRDDFHFWYRRLIQPGEGKPIAALVTLGTATTRQAEGNVPTLLPASFWHNTYSIDARDPSTLR
jgi:RHS repeat-associated protein